MLNLVIAAGTIAYVALTAAVVVFMWLQTRAQRKTMKLQMFHLLAARMEDSRQFRRKVRDYVRDSRKSGGKVVFPLPEDVREAADKVCREFDYLGLLERNDVVEPRLVDLFYSVPFVLLYDDVLGEYVGELRKPENRGPTHFWELVMFYERVRNVPPNHPAISGRSDWPDDPRSRNR